MVSEEDFEKYSKYKWQTTSGYALSWVEGRFQYMHVMICPHKKGQVTDHKDRNRLNNQRDNLRAVDLSLDRLNRGIFSSNELKTTGVRFRKDTGKYTAQISLFKKIFHLGSFDNLADAKNAYEKMKPKI